MYDPHPPHCPPRLHRSKFTPCHACSRRGSNLASHMQRPPQTASACDAQAYHLLKSQETLDMLQLQNMTELNMSSRRWLA